jgi:hypothetical protein
MPLLNVHLKNSKERTGKEYEELPSCPILAGVLIASMNSINASAIIGSILIVAAIVFTLTVKENVTV